MTGPPRTPAGIGAEGAYTAYSYLAAGEDFRRFELAPEFGQVAPYAAGLTAEQEHRSLGLLTDSIVISLHDHPVRYPLRMQETPEYNRTGRQHAAYAGLAASGMTVVFDNMMDGTACVTGNAPWRWNDVITDLGMRQADLAHQRENFTNICGWLVRHGFDDDAIRAVIGGNVYRALQAVWVSP